MTQSSSTSWSWLSPRYLSDTWLPEMLRPEYLEFERQVSLSSDYVRLGDLVEAVPTSTAVTRQGKWYVDSHGMRRGILDGYREDVSPLPMTELPEEAILISQRWWQEPMIHYWNEKLFRGYGTAGPQIWVLKGRTEESIAWLFAELTRDSGILQLRRASAGFWVPYLSQESLLNMRVRRLSHDDQLQANRAVQDQAKSRVSDVRVKNLRRQFVLTGPTFEERLDQFEKYLEVEGLFADAFYAEPATNNRASNLFTIRPLRSSTIGDQHTQLVPQEDSEINERWRGWFWDSSELETHRVFNTLTSDDEIPTHLLLRTISAPCPCVPSNSKCIVPRFSVFRESVLSSIQADVGVEDQMWSSAWVELQEKAGFPIARKGIDGDSNNSPQGEYSFRFAEDMFAWARSIYRPILALKVRRNENIVGVYLLFGEDQTHDYVTAFSTLDDIGIVLADVLAPPSELVEDVTRRESIRRLSWLMHLVNSPVGKAAGALEDIRSFLLSRPDLAEELVPNEETVLLRMRTRTAVDVSRFKLINRLNYAIKQIEDVRRVGYQIKRLKRVQGNLPRNPFDLSEVLRDSISASAESLPDLIVNMDLLASLPVVGDLESIRDSIIEVLNNACREMKERKAMPPSLSVKTWIADDNAWFSISDNGLPADVELMESPFEEDASTYARDGRGSGLGLAIVRESFLAHNGECKLSENYDADGERISGVTFTARLPLRNAATN